MRLKEGSRTWMAWLTDRVCPKCGGDISGVRKGPCPCAEALPCGHRLLGGADAVDRVQGLWANAPGRGTLRINSD